MNTNLEGNSNFAKRRLAAITETATGWQMMQLKKPKGGRNLYDIILDGSRNAIRDCMYSKGGMCFIQIDSHEEFEAIGVYQWCKAKSTENVPCNACQGCGCPTCSGYGYFPAGVFGQ